jgi:hypothetical protein
VHEEEDARRGPDDGAVVTAEGSVEVLRLHGHRGSKSDGVVVLACLSNRSGTWVGTRKGRAPGRHGDGYIWRGKDDFVVRLFAAIFKFHTLNKYFLFFIQIFYYTEFRSRMCSL